MRLMHRSYSRSSLTLVSALAGAVLLIAGCSGGGTLTDVQLSGQAPPQSDAQSEDDYDDEGGTAAEQAAAVTRLAMTYDGGILVVDADTMTVAEDIAMDGFNRVSPAGDGRHVIVSHGGVFQVLDLGTWAQGHGDHFHFFTDTPQLTAVSYTAEVPGHVVAHGGHTIFFDDGTGTVQIADTDQVAEADTIPEVFQSANAHHGVAVVLDDNTLVVSDGDAESRNGLLAFDGQRHQIAETQDCPGIHGEAVAEHDIAAFGCGDGAMLYHDGVFKKIVSPDAGRGISSLFGSDKSHVVLGNYAAAEEGVTSTEITLIDTESEKISVVDLGSPYTFRSFARGDNGEAIALTTDGKLRVLDTLGKELGAYQIVDPWEVPEDWQAPRPSVFAADGNAYVTDPAKKMLYVVDIETGEVWHELALPQVVNEVTGVTGLSGTADNGPDHDNEHGDDHHGHDHDD